MDFKSDDDRQELLLQEVLTTTEAKFGEEDGTY